ncbi:TrpE Anthranilate/para-aminobenzoate synthases component I [Candidatus Nanopelagicaceae bacterium]
MFIGKGHQFWMGGLHATRLAEVTSDPARLDDGNFWAVLTTFEGEYHFARFKKIAEQAFPDAEPWKRLERPWKSSQEMIDFIGYVHEIRKSIEAGGVYQVNACRELSHFLGEKPQKLDSLFSAILGAHPAPFASYLNIPGFEIASASPERFLSRVGNRIITSPIKGTIRWNQEVFGDKDKSENLMIVDLMRNDISQVCTPGSVEVSALFRQEKHPGITHLVSDIEGNLKDGVSWQEILKALLPPGSVSGAPKSSALSIIESNEGARGPYCGALGWIHGDKAELAVAIRTFWTTGDKYLRYGTGAGITWGSDAQSEWEETQLKARHLISIAGGEL